MKTLHRIEGIPQGFDEYYTSDEIGDYDLPEGSESWYWYGYGHYEGTGNMIIRTEDGKWHHHPMGHCSCYGPTCHIDLRDGNESLDELVSRFSEDLMKECQCLIDAINK